MASPQAQVPSAVDPDAPAVEASMVGRMIADEALAAAVDAASHEAAPAGGDEDGASGEEGEEEVEASLVAAEGVVTSRALPPPAPASAPVPAPGSRKGLVTVLVAAPGICLGLLGAVWLLKRFVGGGEKKESQKSRTLRSKDKQAAKKGGKEGKTAKTTAITAAAAVVEEEQPEPEPEEIIEPDTLCIMATECVIEPPPPPPAGMVPYQPLANMIFMVSENIDVAGTPTTVGVPAWEADCAAAAATASAAKKATSAGAACLGKASVQPAMLDFVGDNFGNPLNKSRVSGGSCTGAAAAVASGLCDFALATDMLGESRIPACCTNVFCYRPTPSMVGAPSAAVSAAPNTTGGAPFDSVAVIARTPATLIKVAEAMGVTGSTKLSGEIIKFVVAQDLFDLCAPELQPATVALKKAILKWAGPDQAGAVQLVRFLSGNTDEWLNLAKSRPTTGVQVPLDTFLETTLHGLHAIRDAELHRQHGSLEGVHGRVQMALEVSESDESVSVTLSSGSVLPFEPDTWVVASAHKLARQMFDVLRQTVKPDTIMVLPSMPFPPPKRSAPKIEKDVFVMLCQVFNMMATMGACPTVTLPIGNLRDGSPVSISLFSVHKFDMRLLGVTQRLVPMLQESFQAVKDEITQLAIKQELQVEATALAATAQAATKGKDGKGGADKSASRTAANSKASATDKSNAAADPSVAPAVDPKKLDKAEKFKAKGNESYQAGKYADAITEYTKAINTHPNTHVYYNNRAMACIKLFRFEQAEEDCNRALKFDVSEKDKVKALLRRATARDALQKYDEAERDLRQVLNLEPNNKQAREDLAMLRQHKQEIQAAQQNAMSQQFRAQQAAGGGGMANGGGGMGGMLPGGMGGMGGMLGGMGGGGEGASNAQLQMLQQMLQQHQKNGGQGMPPLPPGFDPSQYDPGLDFDPEDDYGDEQYEEY